MIIPEGRASIYEQIAATVRDQIVTGHYAPGQKLPSKTTLEQEHGVSRVTIRRAMAVLRNQGLVVVHHGHGYHVRDEPELQDLTLPAGSTVTTRMPAAAERAEFDLGDGVPVLVVETPDGERITYPGDRWRLRLPGL